ncbi:sensor histidine kinase [Streptomyces chartreusis]|uniref:sensor histidine kinase n=1 Tax=Streptomyces chartreusis TaxID=1969 RepID=UPI0036F4C786
MKLSTRLALTVGGGVPVLIVACGWLLLSLITDDLRQQQDAQLQARATVVAKNTKNYLDAAGTGQPVVEQVRRQRLIKSTSGMGVWVTGPTGTLRAGPQLPSEQLPYSAPKPLKVTVEGRDWLVLSMPVAIDRQRDRPNLWLFSPDTVEEELALVRRRVYVGAAVALPTAGAVAWAIANRAVLPLRRLQRRTSGLDPRTSSSRLEHRPTRIAEVDDLALTLQTVLNRYDEQVARTGEALATARSFAAAASHELRSPLTSIRANLDVLAGPFELEPAERDELLAELVAEQERLVGLLSMLRTLAQGDLVEAEAFESLDLGELVHSCVDGLRRAHPGTEVSVRAASGLIADGWAEGLRSAVDNLLTNARVHGRVGERAATIVVTLRQSDRPGERTAVLTVDDDGPGVPPERREKIFERFWHGPDSPGSGLGLTLVAQQVALHQGQVSMSDRPDGQCGTRCEVRLPLTGVREFEHTLPLLRRDWLSGAAEASGINPGRG